MTQRSERVVATLLFAMLLAGGFRMLFLRTLVAPHPFAERGPSNGLDRRPLRLWSDATPPELQRFFAAVRAHTRAGERVAVVLAPPFDGFSYHYWRASYVLAGRTVLLPLPHSNPATADVVACWGVPCAGTRVWEGEGGAIVRPSR